MGIKKDSAISQWVIYVAIILIYLISFATWATPKIDSWQTENGARVYFVQADQIPLVDIRVIFNAGSARDNNKPGLAMLTNRMLTMGAGGLNASQLAEQFESVGAKQGYGALRDSAWLSLRSLSKDDLLSKSVNTLVKVLSSPDFNDVDLERERQRTLTGLQQQAQSPASIGKKRFFREIYGTHPYAHLPTGTVEGIKLISKADLELFYKTYYVANNATIAIVGAMSKADAKKLSNRLTEGLQAGEPAPGLPEVVPVKEAKVIRIPHPSSQSHIFMGQVGVARGEKDYFALYLANHSFGGSGLVSILGKEVREKRGMAYSVYSYFSPMGKPGPYIIGMQTRNDKAKEAVKILRQTLENYIKKGMQEDEFNASKKNITGGFPLRVDNNSKISQYLGMIGFYNLPITYLQNFNMRINELKREQVNSAFKNRIKPDKLVTVIVGGS